MALSTNILSAETPGKPANNDAEVVTMWRTQSPNAKQDEACGFPLVAEAQHAQVWEPKSRKDGAFNHYAALIHFKGRWFAMWGNHQFGEDRIGQRILFASADQWNDWPEPNVLFDSPTPMKAKKGGIHLKSDRWMIIDNRLYAIVYVHGVGRYRIAKEVAIDGTPGDPILLQEPRDRNSLPEYFDKDIEVDSQLSEKVSLWYQQQSKVSWWGQSTMGLPSKGIDGANLIEPFTWMAADGLPVLAMRSFPTRKSHTIHNNRLYVARGDGKGNWQTPRPSNIPDSPSRAEAIPAPDGSILLIGNQIAPKFDSALYLDRDPLTVAISPDGLKFTRVLALRSGSPKTWKFSGIRSRNLGFAYPSNLIHNGHLYSFYSVGKEFMEITRAPLSSITNQAASTKD